MRKNYKSRAFTVKKILKRHFSNYKQIIIIRYNLNELVAL